MTPFYSRRAQQRLEQHKRNEVGTGKIMRRRAVQRLIKEGEFMPVTIKDYKGRIPTSNGKTMSSYVLEHLKSGETITATLFENEAPNYIDEKIFDAVLPKNLNEFDAEDLKGRGFNVKVQFNEKNGRTFTNIVDAEPLNPQEQALVDEMLGAEEEDNQPLADDNNGAFISMEEMEADSPYTKRPDRKGSEADGFKSTPSNTRRNSQRRNKRASQVTEDDLNLDEDMDLDLDFDEDDLDIDDNENY